MPEDIFEKILAEYRQQEIPLKAISQKYGYSVGCISRKARERGLKRR